MHWNYPNIARKWWVWPYDYFWFPSCVDLDLTIWCYEVVPWVWAACCCIIGNEYAMELNDNAEQIEIDMIWLIPSTNLLMERITLQSTHTGELREIFSVFSVVICAWRDRYKQSNINFVSLCSFILTIIQYWKRKCVANNCKYCFVITCLHFREY